MTSPKKRVAVIGCGVCGILSMSMLKESGLEPVCYEKTSDPAGTWHYRETPIAGVGSTMSTTTLNHSKEMGAFSNFTPRPEYPNYMRHWEMREYLLDYCKHFDLLKHVRFNSEVVKVKQTEDYEESGRWIVTANDDGLSSSEVYDGIMICVGHMNVPKMPELPGHELFKGKIMHTHDLKRCEEFRDQRVVVLGMGCSALDAAYEISVVAKQVYLSTRSGAWVIPRIGPYGFPTDYIMFRRYYVLLLENLPVSIASWIMEKAYLEPYFDPQLFNVKPDHHVFAKEPILNDTLFAKLLSGSVIQTSSIRSFAKNGVIFEGSNDVTQVDTVIMATGYSWQFPFLEDEVITKKDGRIDLYKRIFPPHLKHPTLAFIGFLLSLGPGFPLAELQARLTVHVLAGRKTLPDEAEMMKDIIKQHNRNSRRYTPLDKMSVRVDYARYMDEISALIGANPNYLKIFFSDFWLFWRLLLGPCLSYQYRLNGPHSWEGARNAIFTVHDRVVAPLKRYKSKSQESWIFSLQAFTIWLFQRIFRVLPQ